MVCLSLDASIRIVARLHRAMLSGYLAILRLISVLGTRILLGWVPLWESAIKSSETEGYCLVVFAVSSSQLVILGCDFRDPIFRCAQSVSAIAAWLLA